MKSLSGERQRTGEAEVTEVEVLCHELRAWREQLTWVDSLRD